MTVVVNSTVQFRSGDLSEELLNALKVEYTLLLPWGGGVYEMFDYNEETQTYRFPRSAHRYLTNFATVKVTLDGLRKIPQDTPKFYPREGQGEAVSSMTRFLSDGVSEKGFSGGIFCARCGAGKTVIASKIAANLGVPTCVLVHKEFLEMQWIEAFGNVLGSSASIGLFRRNKKDTGKTHDIVVASVQTLTSSKRVISEDFLNSFGLLIFDEVHRYGAAQWQKAIWKFPAAMRLGLTATPTRMDGMWPMLCHNIGPVAVDMGAETPDNDVYIVKLRTPLNSDVWSAPWMEKMHRRAAMLTELACHEGRNAAIASQIFKAYEKGRRIIVISERKAQLESLHKRLLDAGGKADDTGFLLGGMKKVDREDAMTKRVLFTTYGMSKEGLDIPALDTLFLASPQSDVTQTVGRILRDQVGKGNPITVDFVDTSVEELIGQAYNRLRAYNSMGCTVHGDLS